MSDAFAVYRDTYYDQSVTDRDGKVLKRKHDHDEPQVDVIMGEAVEVTEVKHAAAEIPSDLVQPRQAPKMIKG